MALTKALQKRIDLANKYIKFAQKHDILGRGYFGSTMESVLTYPHLITVSTTGRSVTVRYKDAYWKKEKHSESFNTNDEYRVSDLRYEISNYIIKAIKNGAKDEGISIPKTLANPTKRKNPAQVYTVMSVSPDGASYYRTGSGYVAGEVREWKTKAAAIKFADSRQKVSDEGDNPGFYYFIVYAKGEYKSREVYHTTPKRKNARGDSMKFLPGGGLQIGEGKPFYPEKEHGPKEARRLLKTRKWSKFVEQWLTYYGKADWRAAKNVSKKFIFGRDSEGSKYEYYQALKVIDPFGWENARSPYKKSNPRRRPTAAQRAAWMKKYTALTGDPQPKPHDYWEGATYFFLTGKTPEEAAERFNARQNPRRRKNTKFAVGDKVKLTWKDWCASIRSELRAYRSGGTTRAWRGQKSWSMQDFKDEVSRLYRKPADEILKELWRQDPTDPSDFVEGVASDLDFESRFPEHRISNPRRRKNATSIGSREMVRPMGVGRKQWDDQVGVTGWSDRGQPKGIYLYELDTHSHKFYRGVPLKRGEKLFRFVSDSTNYVEPHSRYLVKINVDRDLIYFMTEDQGSNERQPSFETRGVKATYLKLKH